MIRALALAVVVVVGASAPAAAEVEINPWAPCWWNEKPEILEIAPVLMQAQLVAWVLEHWEREDIKRPTRLEFFLMLTELQEEIEVTQLRLVSCEDHD